MKVENNETRWILRLEADCGLSSAAELKALLLEGLASGKSMEVDLGAAAEIDITVLQLLWAARHAAERQKRELITQAPEEILNLARDAGFENFPGQALNQEAAEAKAAEADPAEGQALERGCHGEDDPDRG